MLSRLAIIAWSYFHILRKRILGAIQLLAIQVMRLRPRAASKAADVPLSFFLHAELESGPSKDLVCSLETGSF